MEICYLSNWERAHRQRLKRGGPVKIHLEGEWTNVLYVCHIQSWATRFLQCLWIQLVIAQHLPIGTRRGAWCTALPCGFSQEQEKAFCAVLLSLLLRKCCPALIKLPALQNQHCSSHCTKACSCFQFLSQPNPTQSRRLFLLRGCVSFGS